MPDLFRKTSLEKLSSPEQLDRAIVITSPAFWIALGGGFVIVLGALLWAVFGRIPVSVESQGIYLNGEGIRSVYGEVDGIVTEIRVKEGDQVKKGDVVAVVGGGEITAQIEKVKQRIEDVQKVTLDSTSDVATADNKSLLDLKDEQIGLVDAYTQANEALYKKKEELVSERQKEQELKARMDSSKNSYYDVLNNRENTSVELTYSRRQSEFSNSQSEYSIAKQTAKQTSAQEYQARLQYDAQKKTVEDLGNEIQSLTAKEEQLALAVAELETMRQQLEADSAAVEELGIQCEAKEKEVQDLEAAASTDPEIQASLDAARQELQSLREQLSANTAAVEELKVRYEAKVIETETMAGEVRDGSAKKEELSLARQELQSLQQQLDSMTEQNRRAQQELTDAKSRLDQAAGAFESANNEYAAELSRQSEVSSQREIAGNEYTQIVSDYAEQKSKVLCTLKASGAESGYTSRILGYYAKTIRMEQKLGKMQQIINAIPNVFDEVSNVLVLLFGGILVIRGEMTAGMLVAFTSLLDAFVDPVNKLVGFIQKIQTLKADMSRAEDIMRYGQDEKFIPSKRQVVMTSKLSGDVELCDIAFGYSILEKPLVEHFSFHLESERSIAFVGASGCGKSTVSKIVSGLYLPWEGE